MFRLPLLPFWRHARYPLLLVLVATLALGVALRFNDDDLDDLRLTAGGSGQTVQHDGFLADGRIDLNSASQELLETLPDIGPVRAAEIVAAREARPFESEQDFLERSGISEGLYAALLPLAGIG
ncbi:MAG: helix-hairpin-helix domain-containing protein [Dehalococcoidia bacterium]